ncbi:MAG: hypothetical protein ABJA66_08665 [Actinomycetota bacterium]
MTNFSRRQFLKYFGAFSVGFLTARSVYSSLNLPENSAPFELLVVGDSLIFGQGLSEENKFYFLVKEWLAKEFFAEKRAVNLKVKAHSGATITLHETEAEALRKAKKPENTIYNPEISVGFPSIWAQIDGAKNEYENPEKVNLIMLTGGIADLEVANILDIFGSQKKFREAVPKYCFEKMSELLEHSACAFPNALIAVIGYYPMVSKRSSTPEVFNAVLELYGFPRITKPLLNSLLTKPILKMMRQNIINRSKFWAENSTVELQKAVDRLNSKLGRQQAIFIKSPITEENCFGTKNSLLWRMAKKGRSEDALYEERSAVCRRELADLTKSREVNYSMRFCELAGVGHPNIEGSKAYAEAIKTQLKPIFQTLI